MKATTARTGYGLWFATARVGRRVITAGGCSRKHAISNLVAKTRNGGPRQPLRYEDPFDGAALAHEERAADLARQDAGNRCPWCGTVLLASGECVSCTAADIYQSDPEGRDHYESEA